MKVSVGEFLEKLGRLKSQAERVAALKHNDSLVLRMVMQGAFDSSVTWLLPEGPVPYKSNPLQDQEGVFLREFDKIRYFIKGFRDDIKQPKREKMFIELCERLAPKDAELLCMIKDRKMYDGITVDDVLKAFPGCIQDPTPPLSKLENNIDEDEIEPPTKKASLVKKLKGETI